MSARLKPLHPNKLGYPTFKDEFVLRSSYCDPQRIPLGEELLDLKDATIDLGVL